MVNIVLFVILLILLFIFMTDQELGELAMKLVFSPSSVLGISKLEFYFLIGVILILFLLLLVAIDKLRNKSKF